MSNSNTEQVLAEVEALEAIYGEEAVSFRERRSENEPASISIALEALVFGDRQTGRSLTLSALLPSEYPSEAAPKTPTLRGDGISAAQSAKFVHDMLTRQKSVTGEVCIFEYCEAIVSLLKDASVGVENDGQPGPSSVAAVHDEVENLGHFKIFHGEALTDRKSVFQAQLGVISCEEDVDRVLQYLKQMNRKIATASHNTLAYRVVGPSGNILQDCDDDGEKGAGKGVLYVLQQMDAVNIVCIVTRWFGGTKLGPVRFKHICKVARDVVETNSAALTFLKLSHP